MSTFNDCKYNTLVTLTGLTGNVQDLYYIALNGPADRTISINELEFVWLGLQGVTSKHLNGRWMEFLENSGYNHPSLQERKKQWWCDGAPGLGLDATYTADTTLITADTTLLTADVY